MIYLVEDDSSIRELVIYALNSTGLEAKGFEKPSEFWKAVEEEEPSLVILDVMLPEESGIDVLKKIRSNPAIEKLPVIMETAKTSEYDRINGLESGADDYISKPFEIVELLARVETVLRRYNKIGKTIRILDVEIDLSSRVVTQNGQQVLLTLKEFELLLFFARNPNIALYREVIYEQVWEKEYTGDSRTIDLHVQRLKKKLGWEKHICAVYKIGYRLET